MRLLAVTAGDDAQGRITEADQVVGQITAGGTVGFVVFTALFFGPATAAATCCCGAGCPAGRAGGLAYGALLLVRPGRGSNRSARATRTSTWWARAGCRWSPSPRWCCSTACWSPPWPGRVSRAVPLLGREPRAIAAHAPLLLLAPLPPVAVVLAVVGALVVLATRVPPVVAGLARPPPRPGRAGRPGPGRPARAARLPLRRRRHPGPPLTGGGTGSGPCAVVLVESIPNGPGGALVRRCGGTLCSERSVQSVGSTSEIAPAQRGSRWRCLGGRPRSPARHGGGRGSRSVVTEHGGDAVRDFRSNTMLAIATSLVGMLHSLASIWSALASRPPSSRQARATRSCRLMLVG